MRSTLCSNPPPSARLPWHRAAALPDLSGNPIRRIPPALYSLILQLERIYMDEASRRSRATCAGSAQQQNRVASGRVAHRIVFESR